MQILLFSTLYPNAAFPAHGVFVENRLLAYLSKHDADVQVIAPVPWFPSDASMFGEYARYASVPLTEKRHGLTVRHPRYRVIPKIGMELAPDALARCLGKELDALAAQGWEPDFIDAHYFYPDGVAAAKVARERDLPFVITARGTDINLIPEYPGPRADILQTAIAADAVITVASALKERLVELGAPAEKIAVLRNGVDLELFTPCDRDAARKALGFAGPVIASIGHLIERKGHHLAIDALKEIDSATLVIAGEGKERRALEAQAKASGLEDRVKFLGAVPHDELKTVYNAADVLILASSREGWPNVLLEAMACGTPCVAANVWGNAEVISSPGAGALATERTPQAIAETVKTLLANSPSREDTRAHAEAHSWDATADGMHKVFTRLEQKSRRARATTASPLWIPASDNRSKLIVTVDTEEQFDWTRFEPHAYTLAPTEDIERFQTVCEEAGAAPLYFLSWPLINDAGVSAYYRAKRDAGLADCGLHLHPWVTPPHRGLKGEYYSYQKNYPDADHREKLAALADRYEGAFGARAIAHRAGRYGIAKNNYAFLAEIGVKYDFSPSSGYDFSPAGGADFSGYSNKPFRAATLAGDVFVTPVCGARALRYTKRFQSQEFNAPGFAPPRKRSARTEPVRLTPEASDFPTLKALTRRLIKDETPVLSFTIHSTSLTIGATDYGPDAAIIDSMLTMTRDYLAWFRDEIGGEIISLRDLAALYEKTGDRN